MPTYYVDPTKSDDTGDGLSLANAKKNLQAAANLATAGSLVICCGTAVHAPSAKIDFNINAGSLAAGPITFVAGDGSGNPVYDGSVLFRIRDDNIVNTPLLDFPNTTAKRLRFYGFDIEGGVGSATIGVNMGTADSTGDACIFENCKIHGFATAGVSVRNGGTDASNYFVGCDIYDNNIGIIHGASARGQYYAINTKFHDNTSHGIDCQQVRCHFINCASYDNGGSGFNFQAVADNGHLINCTAYGNAGSGLRLQSVNVDYKRIINCSFVGNGAYGIETAEGIAANADAYVTSCHFHSNTSGDHEDGTLNTLLTGFNHVTGDPLFVSVTDGSEDFHFGDGSPLQDAGPLGDFVGAFPIDPAEIGGGGVSFIGIQSLESGVIA